MSTWEKYRLGDIADLSLGKMLDEKKNRGDMFPYLANVNVRWGIFELENLREMRFEPKDMERFGVISGDIVMCEGGEPGRCAIWNDAVPGMMLQKALHRIRPKIGFNYQFLFYSFLYLGKTDGFSHLLTGATIKHLPLQSLAKLEVKAPPLAIQERIAESLSSYDDLIENNRRRMTLLEQSARLLYEEWFVRLRFPGHEHTRIVEGVPEGWHKVPLGKIVGKIGSGFTPRGGDAAYLPEGTPLIRSLNVYDDQFQDDGLAFISDEQALSLAGVTVESKDILLNITGASVARCCMAPERYLPARVNQHVMIIRVDREKADPFFVHKAINSDERKRQLLSFAQKGSTREALTKEMVSKFEIVVPPVGLMRQFGGVASQVFQQRETLALQNQKLRAARDLLLPRLMSGELVA
ncbi:restriction endonuclease subunit S [Sphaerotilus sp.]|uniref:restriction endonuclease subunit S n=1 Tax=Sphaerotilus sp. TaxID=2093942 RepID=UPI002ACDC837|nr:restriction endonuclease subunit S [Sphaerotilus sp.]MDZ7856829.1 restriction endonuclease subunit S [Sphaerotilus sp.]